MYRLFDHERNQLSHVLETTAFKDIPPWQTIQVHLELLNACLKIILSLESLWDKTNILVQYLSTITSVNFEFSKNLQLPADLTHFSRKMRIL